VRSLKFSLFADYFQFYIQDEAVDGDLSASWSEEATERLLAIAPGVIGIGTARNMDVPVLLEIHDDEPAEDFFHWDHVVECGLNVTSGRLVIAGCTDYFPEAARVDLISGEYRARVSFGALDKLSEDRLDGEDNYRVQLWPGSAIAPRIIKQRKT
jgi:hypothetical protein